MKNVEEIIQENPQDYATDLNTIFVKSRKGMNVYAGVTKAGRIDRYDSKLAGKNYIDYIYHINIVTNPEDVSPQLTTENVTVFRFISSVFSVKFLEGLINYYDVIINNIIDTKTQTRKISQYLTELPKTVQITTLSANYLTGLTQKADKFVKKNKNKTFTQEMMLEYFIILSNFYKTNQEIKDRVQYHLDHYKKDDDYTLIKDNKYNITDNIQHYLSPGFSVFTDKEREFLNNENAVVVFKLYNSVEIVKLAYKIMVLLLNYHYPDYSRSSNIDTSVKVKDLDANDLDVTVNYFNTNIERKDYHIEVDAIAEFINNLTIEQFQTMSNNTDLYDLKNVLEFTKLAEFTVGKKLSHVDKKMLKRAENNVIKHAENTTTKYVTNFYKTDPFKKFNEYYIVKTLDDYFDSLADKKLSVGEIKVLSSVINGKSRYITNAALANWLFYELNNIFTVNEIIDLITEVVMAPKVLSVKEWVKFLDNYEEYMEMPVAWWVKLI